MSTNKQIDLIEIPSSPEKHENVAKFYEDTFGWEFTHYGDEYSDTKSSGLTFGINSTNGNKQSTPLTVLYSENLEETKQKVINAGGKIIADIYSFPGGK